MNPWLEIPLEDYEAHMSLASVGQAQFLSRVLEQRVRELCPESVAVLGCAGGNGFECLSIEHVKRVVGIDINPHYLAAARARYAGRFDRLELICTDLGRLDDALEPVDLVFAGLVFEYVDIDRSLSSIARIIKKDGHLLVVLQLPNDSMAAITPTPYTSLRKLEGALRHVHVGDFEAVARRAGLVIRSSDRVTLGSGKSFQEVVLKMHVAC